MKYVYSFILTVLIASVIGCEDDAKFSITPALGFLRNEGSISQTDEAGTRIRFHSNVTITEPVTVKLSINNLSNLEYGIHYTTDPAVVDGLITVNIDPEDEQPSIFVFPIQTGAEGIQRIGFEIFSVEGSNIIPAPQRAAREFILSIKGFEEIIPITVTHNFNTCTTDFNTPAGFIEVFEGSKTDRGWGCRDKGVGGSRAPRASAFGGAAGEDRAWMIMNPIAIGVGATVSIKFSVFSEFEGPGKVSVKWSSNYSGAGNPLAANWTTLTTLDNQIPPANNLAWVDVTGTFTNISGSSVYFAFVYTEGLASGSTAYDIDDLTIKVE